MNTQALAPPKLRLIINPADWEGLPVPPREWIVPDYIPHKTVTLLSGDGYRQEPACFAISRCKSDRARMDRIATWSWPDAEFCPPRTMRTKCTGAQGRNVSAAKGPTYAPAVFAAEPGNQDIKSSIIFDAAMRRLLNVGRIRIETTGPASRRRSALILGDNT